MLFLPILRSTLGSNCARSRWTSPKLYCWLLLGDMHPWKPSFSQGISMLFPPKFWPKSAILHLHPAKRVGLGAATSPNHVVPSFSSSCMAASTVDIRRGTPRSEGQGLWPLRPTVAA